MKALIFNNKIVQVAAADFPVNASMQWLDCPEGCTTEWTYTDGVFSPPAPPSCPSIEERRATAILGPMELADKLHTLNLFDTVNEWANAQGGMISYAWNRATQFERLHPLVLQAQISLNMTDEQIDSLFNINV